MCKAIHSKKNKKNNNKNWFSSQFKQFLFFNYRKMAKITQVKVKDLKFIQTSLFVWMK